MSYELEHCRKCGKTYSAGMMHTCPVKQDNLKDLNLNACRKHQDVEVYGKYGQRGCLDCVWQKEQTALVKTKLLEGAEHFNEYDPETQHIDTIEAVPVATIKSLLEETDEAV